MIEDCSLSLSLSLRGIQGTVLDDMAV